MNNTKIIHVSHLGGIDVGYLMPRPYDPHKPTLVLVNSFTTTAELYRTQFEDPDIADNMNLLAIEPLGHGQTRAVSESFTYWDTAFMNLQVMEGLGIEKAFVLGTSQGGWVTVRMALLAPHRIEGIMPLGTCMDVETREHRSRNRIDGVPDLIDAMQPTLASWTAPADIKTPDFELDDYYCNFLLYMGFGPDGFQDIREFWTKEIKANYRGDEGRRRVRMAGINLRDRDGLHERLGDVRCPVMWVHGTADIVYPVDIPEKEIKLFINSTKAEVIIIEGGTHFLNASNPRDVNRAILKLVLQSGPVKAGQKGVLSEGVRIHT